MRYEHPSSNGSFQLNTSLHYPLTRLNVLYVFFIAFIVYECGFITNFLTCVTAHGNFLMVQAVMYADAYYIMQTYTCKYSYMFQSINSKVVFGLLETMPLLQ